MCGWFWGGGWPAGMWWIGGLGTALSVGVVGFLLYLAWRLVRAYEERSRLG